MGYSSKVVEDWVDDLVEYYFYGTYTKEEVEDSLWDNIHESCESNSEYSNEKCLDLVADRGYFDWEDMNKRGYECKNFRQVLYCSYLADAEDYYDEILEGVLERLGLTDSEEE